MNLSRKKTYNIKDYSKREVNLLPQTHQKVGKIKIYRILSIFVVIIAIALAGYYEYTIYQNNQDLEAMTKQMKDKILANQETIENQAIIMSLDGRIALKEYVLNYIFSSNRSIVEILDIFESKMNHQIYLTNLNANSTTSFTINATATSDDAIAALINQLKRLKTINGDRYFSSVFTSGITRNEDENGLVSYVFTLECEFEGGADYEIQ